jgi:electron transfer flavoprotein-quinone oxidoreductase
MVLTDDQAVSVDFRERRWAEPPYNGATAYRPDWDHWLASKAEADGAILVCSTTATGLIRERGRVVGVTTDRPEGDLRARIVIACDGVNSFLAKEAGMYGEVDAANYTVGVKETIALPKDVIDERFGVRGREGMDIEILGGTSGVNGGGFVYTNLDTLAVGCVLKLPKLAAQKTRPEEIIEKLKNHPGIFPLVEGGEVKEYSAHVIPEAGLKMMPKMTGDGILICGDAAAMCLAAGLWLEGVNFAMGSGIYAGEAASDALASGDCSANGLAGYERRLKDTFVLRDHKRLHRAPAIVLSDRVQHLYPTMIANSVERMFRVDNPRPKPGLIRVLNEERKRAGLKVRHIVRDTVEGLRTFG